MTKEPRDQMKALEEDAKSSKRAEIITNICIWFIIVFTLFGLIISS